MRRAAMVAAVMFGLVAAGCGSGSASPAATSAATGTVSTVRTATGCDNSAGPDYIVWEQSPGAQTVAQELGAYNLSSCQTTPEFLQRTSPTGTGYCTLVAPASANPGYDVNASPPVRPKGVIESIGSCG